MFRLTSFIVAACISLSLFASESSAQQKYTAEEQKQAAEWAMWSGRITDAEYAFLVGDETKYEQVAFHGRFRRRVKWVGQKVTHPLKTIKGAVTGKPTGGGCANGSCHK